MAESERDIEITAHQLVVRRENAFRERRSWYIAQGILFIVAGLLAFIVPAATVWGLEILFAVLLIVSGIYQAYHGFTDGSGWMIFSGLMSLGVGIFLLVMPVAGVIAVATIIAFFLFVEGVVEVILSLQMRFSRRWGWLLASGVLSILLSVLLLIGWPEQTVVLAGIFLGVNFLFYGVSLLALVASIRQSGTAEH